MYCRTLYRTLPLSLSLLLSQSGFSTNINAQQAFQHLHHVAPSLSQSALKSALHAYQKAASQHLVRKPYLTVIDYSQPSSKQRMWIFDLKREKLLMNTYVAHGQNSGTNYARHFSNTPSSKASSLGAYVTQNTYYGSNGLSLNLKGLEHGYNDNALSRRVVVHGAWYVEPGFIKQTGHAGRSWGCPAVAKSIASSLIRTIQGGTVVYAYYPDFMYLHRSNYA